MQLTTAFTLLADSQQAHQREQGQASGAAILFLNEKQLFLYNGSEADSNQRFGLDRSGVGRGNLTYSPLASSTWEIQGWFIDEFTGELNFDDSHSLLACPGPDGSYLVYLQSNFGQPAGHSDCIPEDDLAGKGLYFEAWLADADGVQTTG
ncbi:uncharacterized protein C8A04DRAFT_29929 [Dichotomopilus funicola]|uniref:Uncharacterized protein n=1 Tax=Dichotomopilus funicola TaxID=1934379 RepID=A0AAN6V0I3_9PEZI|nr:hypothetical protein C8A04DRAFT_29929 [Dichotomopilus funicola]